MYTKNVKISTCTKYIQNVKYINIIICLYSKYDNQYDLQRSRNKLEKKLTSKYQIKDNVWRLSNINE